MGAIVAIREPCVERLFRLASHLDLLLPTIIRRQGRADGQTEHRRRVRRTSGSRQVWVRRGCPNHDSQGEQVSQNLAAPSGTFTLGGDLPVVRLGYGTMQLPGKGVWGPPRDHDEAIRVLRRAVELGNGQFPAERDGGS
jgi:hypothetical protein